MAETYVAGAVSKLLGGETVKKSSDSDRLTSLFCQSPPRTGSKMVSKKFSNMVKNVKVSRIEEDHTTPTKKKRKKSKIIDELEEQYEKKKMKMENVDGTQSKKPEVINETKKEFPRPRRDRKKRNPNQEGRTIFVGNLSIDVNKKNVEKLFKKYGVIESVRFRSAAPADLDLPKKATVITKSFHENRHNLNCYVVFNEQEAAKEALRENGTLLDGLHLRVDLVTKSNEHKHSNSIFVGNLPFDVEEEPVREHFADCGDIDNVRIIRDSKTQLGKGFGYVLFADKSSVELALKLNRESFNGRKLRVSRSSKKPSGGDAAKNKMSKFKTAFKKKGANVKADGKVQKGRKPIPNKGSFQGVKAKMGEKFQKPKQKSKQFVKKSRSGAKKDKKKQSRKIQSSRIGAFNRISTKIKKKAKKSKVTN